MNKIFLQGRLANKVSTFRKELKELQKDWEVSYTFSYMFLNDDNVQITIKGKDGYISKATLLLDADTLSDFIEQWTEFRTEQITIN